MFTYAFCFPRPVSIAITRHTDPEKYFQSLSRPMRYHRGRKSEKKRVFLFRCRKILRFKPSSAEIVLSSRLIGCNIADCMVWRDAHTRLVNMTYFMSVRLHARPPTVEFRRCPRLRCDCFMCPSMAMVTLSVLESIELLVLVIFDDQGDCLRPGVVVFFSRGCH